MKRTGASLLERLRDGGDITRGESLDLWQRVAAGQLRNDQRIVLALQKRLQATPSIVSSELLELIDEMASNFAEPVDLIEWIERAARSIAAADEQPDSNDRNKGLVAAIGLKGKKDEHAELRRELAVVQSFDTLDPPVDGHGFSAREFAYEFALKLHPEWKVDKKEAVLQRIDRIREEILRDQTQKRKLKQDGVLDAAMGKLATVQKT